MFAKALAEQPADRYPSCGEFAGALYSALSLAPELPAIGPIPERDRPPTEGWLIAPSPGTGHTSPVPMPTSLPPDKAVLTCRRP